jgi:hypothetical protein
MAYGGCVMPTFKPTIGVVLEVPSKDRIPTVESLRKIFCRRIETSEAFLQQIQTCTALFLLTQSAEQAPTKQELVKRLEKLGRQIKNVKNCLSNEPPPALPCIEGHLTSPVRNKRSEEQINRIIQRHFRWSSKTIHFPHTVWQYILIDALDGIYAISDWVIRELANPLSGGFDTGYAWNLWINQLTELMQTYKLPHKVNKATGARPSEFVNFVWAIQELLPMEARKHHQSKDALAQAIVRARRPSDLGH